LTKTKTNLSFNQIKPARAIRQVFYIFANPIHDKFQLPRPSENTINDIHNPILYPPYFIAIPKFPFRKTYYKIKDRLMLPPRL
ncbi:hypothetical protein, partial [Neisseria sp.]